LQLPIGKEAGFKGIVDLVKMKGIEFTDDESGTGSDCDIPAELNDTAQEINQKLIEDIAESSEELLDKYLEEGELSADETTGAIKQGVKDFNLFCVMCGSAGKNFSVRQVLDFVVNYFPSPIDVEEVVALDVKTNEEKKIKTGENEPFFAYIFKTVADPYAGKLTIFRVFSGELTPDSTVYNSKKDTKEKVNQILKIEGKNQKQLDVAVAGDIVAVAKLKEATTGDTFCDESLEACFKSIELPKPVTSYAVEAKTRGDEDKMASSLSRLMEEDPTLQIKRNDETREFILSGIGQVHLDVAAARLKRKFGVDIAMKRPKIPYKETIRGKTKSQGRHKKQTGGRGQFADTWIEIEPLPRGGGF
ncbi:MAG: elongation factor G, partial [Deltaproteobacteria bacterium]|nr:elongation factor G [Deltaproteobacteria bacterium]